MKRGSASIIEDLRSRVSKHRRDNNPNFAQYIQEHPLDPSISDELRDAFETFMLEAADHGLTLVGFTVRGNGMIRLSNGDERTDYVHEALTAWIDACVPMHQRAAVELVETALLAVLQEDYPGCSVTKSRRGEFCCIVSW